MIYLTARRAAAMMNARTLLINPDPAAYLEQDLPCDERDREHMMTKERH